MRPGRRPSRLAALAPQGDGNSVANAKQVMSANHRPRLYLVTPPLGEPAAFARGLDAVLAAGDVAALLLRLDDADERTLINRAKDVAAIVQPRGIALLLDGRPEIAARAGADGAHLTGIAALTAAIGALKPGRIAGAGGLKSRHDAMLAGEANADYVMFGEPDRHGRRPPFAADDRAGSLVGGSVRSAVRRLCAKSRRSFSAGTGRQRFHRAWRVAMDERTRHRRAVVTRASTARWLRAHRRPPFNLFALPTEPERCGGAGHRR